MQGGEFLDAHEAEPESEFPQGVTHTELTPLGFPVLDDDSLGFPQIPTNGANHFARLRILSDLRQKIRSRDKDGLFLRPRGLFFHGSTSRRRNVPPKLRRSNTS